ncbi:DNA-binding transcriptional regulator [Acinetobacter sp. ANC 4169]|uniref:helix-turn-helix transcriptional regulator n=1 Tax=Acinetobacter sp. ANC 4169 TaxID=1977879 RepID=UPI000A34C8E2|nr:WYL domain-containing protein [Acinetobacter sp. ANC 4169]OTG75415.1 DNA-binding transcriptional regulator [Acinetobacter sp. ANC 4169]
MKGNPSTHERLAERLARILTKLNVGHQLSVHELALEFRVSSRTIERDFDRLNSYLPLIHDTKTKKFYLDSSYLGRFKLQDIQNFAQLSGIQNLYPSLDISFLRELFDNRSSLVFSAKGYNFEDNTQYAEHFKLLTGSIQKRQQIALFYRDQMRVVKPYRLIHHMGNWYLAAVRKQELRVYRLGRIEKIICSHQLARFEHDQAVLQQLKDEDGIWFQHQKQEVVLSVHPDAAIYFKQRRIFPEQMILEESQTGELLISCQIRHQKELHPLVRYWVPYLKILQPAHLQQELDAGLQGYLQRNA